MSPFSQNIFACRDFFGLLRDILSGLFGWFDRLEVALTHVTYAPGLPVGRPCLRALAFYCLLDILRETHDTTRTTSLYRCATAQTRFLGISR